jgi:hypothetical protein
MTETLNDPGSAAGINWTDLKGALLLFTVDSVEKDIDTMYGKSDAIRCDVVVLDGDQKDEDYTDMLVFPKVLQSQLRAKVGGQKVLGRLGQGEAKKGQDPPWKLELATDADRKVGMAYLDRTAKAPF